MEKYILELPRYLSDAPACWKKFTDKCYKEGKLIEDELSDYGAILVYSDVESMDAGIHGWCMFKTEEDFIMFKLKWS